MNGVGGVFPQLFIYNGTFVEREEVANSPDENIVCRDYQEDDSVRYYLKMKDDPSSWNRWYNRDDENFHKGFLEAIQKVV
ncbi:MAG: hypothetical protein LBO09_01715 [Candidatus Peribacteria bacterium]|nr:hypothetical protein [Candidatus Peribacteria bacterium]